MPRFLYTIVLAAVGFWILVGNVLLNTRPDSTAKILYFLLLFFAATALTTSIPAYFLFLKKAPNFTNLRFLYRKAIKWGVFVGSLISIFLGLRAFGLGSTLNLALLLILYVMIFLQFRKSR